MQAYEYQALTAAGATARGVVQADSARAARALLRERGLMPLDVQGVDEQQRQRAVNLRGHGRERALLLRQTSSLLAAGLPLEEVLSVLVEQADRARARRQLGAIRARVWKARTCRPPWPNSPDCSRRCTAHRWPRASAPAGWPMCSKGWPILPKSAKR